MSEQIKEVVLDWADVLGDSCECAECVSTLMVSTFVLMTEHKDLPVRVCGQVLCRIAEQRTERGLLPTEHLSEVQLRQVLVAHDWLRDNRPFLGKLSRAIAFA